MPPEKEKRLENQTLILEAGQGVKGGKKREKIVTLPRKFQETLDWPKIGARPVKGKMELVHQSQKKKVSGEGTKGGRREGDHQKKFADFGTGVQRLSREAEVGEPRPGGGDEKQPTVRHSRSFPALKSIEPEIGKSTHQPKTRRKGKTYATA